MLFTNRTGRNIRPDLENFNMARWVGTHSYGSGEESVHYYNFCKPSVVEGLRYDRDGGTLKFEITASSLTLAQNLWDKLKKADFNVEGTHYSRTSEWNYGSKVVSVKIIEQPTNATYIDDFLAICSSIVEFPAEIIQDVKEVIACTCVLQFQEQLKKGKPLSQAKLELRPCALNGVPSPYILAAKHLIPPTTLNPEQYKEVLEDMALILARKPTADKKMEAEGTATPTATTTTTTVVGTSASVATTATTTQSPPVTYLKTTLKLPPLSVQATSSTSSTSTSSTLRDNIEKVITPTQTHTAKP